MNDIDDLLRQLFERKAAEVQPHSVVPRTLRRRSRQRLALNGLLAGVVAIALGSGTVGALRSIDRAGGTTPGGQPSGPVATPSQTPNPSPTIATPSQTSSESPSGVVACAPGALGAEAQIEGAMGSREGAILVTNDSDMICTLSGYPGLVLLDAGGAREPAVAYDQTDPAWRVNDEPRPAGWPVVTLRPGDVGSFRVRWTNWCPDGRDAPDWRIDMGSGSVDVPGTDTAGSPPCLDQSAGSTLEVGPYEPVGN
jgi:hypothetical protein